jgi:BirA family biotin operon repressor/biotin-[acetyl-CoA-carboxylase] ligase
MDIIKWSSRLSQLPLGEVYIYHVLESTNQVAEDLIHQGAPAFSLVAADSQTAGRGRHGRTWITRKQQALAFSLILYPDQVVKDIGIVDRLSGLGALAVAETLSEKYNLDARIKWPNDILVNGKKIAGILVDLSWTGEELTGAVLGVGVNVRVGSLPDNIELNYPAATLEDFYPERVCRLDLLIEIISRILKWYAQISKTKFLTTWEKYLAFVSEEVILSTEDGLIDQGVLFLSNLLLKLIFHFHPHHKP